MLYNLDYVYDYQPTLGVTTPVEMRKCMEPERRTKIRLISQDTEDVVGDSPVTVNLTPNPERPINLELLGPNSPPNSPAPRGYAIEITVSYIGKPVGVYEVYLNLPKENTASDREAHSVGAMYFFVLRATQPVNKTFRFDITDELLSQFQRDGIKINNQPLAISIIKEGGEEAENITIKNISLYSY